MNAKTTVKPRAGDQTLQGIESLSVGNAVDGMNIPLDGTTLPSLLPLLSLETMNILDAIHASGNHDDE